MKKELKAGVTLLSGAIFACLLSQAQAQQVIPNAGQIIQSNQQHPSAQSRTAPAPEQPPQPVIETPKPTETATDSRHSFRVDVIHVEDAKHMDPKKIEAIIAPYEHRDLTLAQLNEISKKLSNLYHEQGFVTTIVYLPPQRIESRTVTFKTVEGIIGEVNYEPLPAWPARTVLPRLSGHTGDLFDADAFRRELRRINQNPDFKVNATLEAGKETGETDIHLKGDGQQPVHISLFYDNLGRPIIGRQRAGITTTHNNFLGLGDQLTNSVSWTHTSFGTVTHYQVPLGPHGTSLNFDHAYSTLKLGYPLKDADITGKAYVYSGYLRQEVLNTDNGTVSLDLGFDFDNVKTFQKDNLIFRDRIRMLHPALNSDWYDPYGRTIMRHELGIGLDILGGSTGDTHLASRPHAGTKFFRYTGSLTRVQKMPWNTLGIFRMVGQASPDRLPSVEQFQAGGAFSVRGYLEGQIIGDAGWMSSAEWHVPAFIFPKTWKLPHTDYNLRQNVQFVTFADYAAVFTNKPTAGLQPRTFLFGIGTGVRANLTRFLTARVDLGIPMLHDEVPGNQYPRLHFGLESRLF